MMAQLTLVRSKETGEPVMAAEKIEDIVSLGRTIDEITDPATCEYVDVDCDIDFQLFFSMPSPDFSTCEESQLSCCESAGMSFLMIEFFIDLFMDEDLEWVEFPDQMECLSEKKNIEDRFWEYESRVAGDVF